MCKHILTLQVPTIHSLICIPLPPSLFPERLVLVLFWARLVEDGLEILEGVEAGEGNKAADPGMEDVCNVPEFLL